MTGPLRGEGEGKGLGHEGKRNFFLTFFSNVPTAIKLEGGGLGLLGTFFAASLSLINILQQL